MGATGTRAAAQHCTPAPIPTFPTQGSQHWLPSQLKGEPGMGRCLGSPLDALLFAEMSHGGLVQAGELQQVLRSQESGRQEAGGDAQQ